MLVARCSLLVASSRFSEVGVELEDVEAKGKALGKDGKSPQTARGLMYGIKSDIIHTDGRQAQSACLGWGSTVAEYNHCFARILAHSNRDVVLLLVVSYTLDHRHAWRKSKPSSRNR